MEGSTLRRARRAACAAAAALPVSAALVSPALAAYKTGCGSHMRQRLTVTRSRGFGPLAMTSPRPAGGHGR
jgi:hypothetical protein